MKVSVIGAGNVGAMTAMRLVEKDLCDVELIDIAAGLAKGKSEDIMDAASVIGYDTKISGSEDFSAMKGSFIIINTAGFARKPGMTREELLSKNTAIVKQVGENIKKYAPEAIVINVANPLDAMTYVIYKTSSINSKKVIGMAGLLDSSRMDLAIARVLNKPVKKIDSTVLGTHGETMVPVPSETKVAGKKLSDILSDNQIKEITEKTKNRGAEIVSYLKTGSAFFGPSACAAKMAEIILKDKKETITCSCLLSGEYGIKDIYLGVLAVLGKNGIEKIIELKLSKQELSGLTSAAAAVKELINQCTI
ncbi:MAG: malate dehydrogenase [Candidatus Omnitrophica bacterium]|nr:malate dehydrogenase [Candidatus Omnitrophota bacterium]